jgi:hypothetical protein
VRHAAGEGLVAVAELLRVEDQGQHILTIVLQLSHDDEEDELRMAAVRIFDVRCMPTLINYTLSLIGGSFESARGTSRTRFMPPGFPCWIIS